MQDEIKIEGMGCEHCVTAVKRALEQVSGVEVDGVEIGTARVRTDRDATSAIDEAIRQAGYEPVSHTKTEGLS